MKITKTQNGTKLVIALSGRLDTTTAPDLEKEANTALSGITDLTIDFTALEYISSVGLRALLSMQKTMNKQGKMRVRNANASVSEIFEITGFNSILTIE